MRKVCVVSGGVCRCRLSLPWRKWLSGLWSPNAFPPLLVFMCVFMNMYLCAFPVSLILGVPVSLSPFVAEFVFIFLSLCPSVGEYKSAPLYLLVWVSLWLAAFRNSKKILQGVRVARHLGNSSCISDDSTTFCSQAVSSIKVTLATSSTSAAVDCKLNDWEETWKEGREGRRGSKTGGEWGVWGIQGNTETKMGPGKS